MIAFCEPAEDTEREARSDRKNRLIEVASMVDEFGLSIDEAAKLACVDVGSDPLPSKRIFCPPPDWLAELCAEVQATWTPEERARRYEGPKQHEWTMPDISSREMGW